MSESEQSHILSADEIWAAQDVHEEVVPISEWGGSVKVRALTLKQIASITAASTKRNPKTGQDDTDRGLQMLLFVIEGVIEPKMTMANLERLGEKSAAAVTKIVQAINALGATEDAINEATKSDASKLNGAVPALAGPRVEDDAGNADGDHVDQ